MLKEIERYFDFPENYKSRYKKIINNFNNTKKKYENIIKMTDKEEQRRIKKYTTEKPGAGKYVKLLNEMVFPAVEKIRTKEIEKITDKYEYKPRVFHNQIFELYKKLERDILPNEILKNQDKDNEPAYWVSILNAGYFHYLTNNKFIGGTDVFNTKSLSNQLDEYSSEELFYQKQKLSSFILRAIEVSEIHRRFIEEKRQT